MHRDPFAYFCLRARASAPHKQQALAHAHAPGTHTHTRTRTHAHTHAAHNGARARTNSRTNKCRHAHAHAQARLCPHACRRQSREVQPHQPALLEAGVAALAWGLMGYTLLVAQNGCVVAQNETRCWWHRTGAWWRRMRRAADSAEPVCDGAGRGALCCWRRKGGTDRDMLEAQMDVA